MIRTLRLIALMTLLPLTVVALEVAQAIDNTPPPVAITSPAEDAGVSGVFALRATASDDVGVVGVQFQLDLVDYGAEDTEAPFEVQLSADAIASGAHLVSAVARDAAGNVGTSELVTFVVCGPLVQPCPGAPGVPPNAAPTAVTDSLTSQGGVAVIFTSANLLANDTDPENQPLTVVNVAATTAQGGTVVSNGSGSWTYTPRAGFAGTDTFAYTISDGVASDAGEVRVVVTAPVSAGLVLHYTFDESDPVNVTDGSGNGNHGVIRGAVRAAGVNGNGLRFDGADDWVTVADAASLDLSPALTIEAWVNPASASGWTTVAMKERAGGLAYALYAHDGAPLAGGTNLPAGYVNIASTDQPVRGTTALPLNTWSHLAMTFDGAALRFYVNGTAVRTRLISGVAPVSNAPLRIGGNAVWNEFFAGVLDELRIYNRALTAAEVLSDMTGTAPPAPVNHPPIAVSDTLTTTMGTAVTVSEGTLLANDSDPNGDALHVVAVAATSAAGGTIVSSVSRNWTYTPPAGFAGTDSVSYTIADAAGLTATGTISVQVNAPSPPASGLVLALHFDDGSGATVADASGGGNHGTVSGAVFSPAGKFGGALSFDGVDDWVTVADAASLDVQSAMTIEAWVMPTASSGNWRTVVLKERLDGLAYALYAHDGAPLAGGTDRPAGYVRLGGIDRAVRGSAALPLNTWTHLAVTYDGAVLKFYVNGTEVATQPFTGLAPATARPLRIGGNAPWGEFFRGMIDEVRVYNRALSPTQIQADMNTPIR